ncbi:D-glycero-alpha-D-manno-heptose-1,7-bisphosphate 7-phosphatase [Gorillibacterium timonense]|uniref:D-glycero-alpha-D-manno-heptose-1,7-bisphosphate 7-phosphatase n=1 Tax=Gorillibacterium timonense TaxID=1689269 RepID=UPI00071C44B6|nr:HAD family hydrolase [Gorillibacterium timonense]
MNRAVFLDRDGVINECQTDRVRHVNHPHQLFLFPGVPEAIKALNDAGYLVFVVTNQGGIGFGFMKEASLHAIHERMTKLLLEKGAILTDIAYCPHRPKAGCECRKPKPGMLKRLAEKHAIDMSASIMVGDRDTDIMAGRAAGCKTVRIGAPDLDADHSAPSLAEAVPWLLGQLVRCQP